MAMHRARFEQLGGRTHDRRLASLAFWIAAAAIIAAGVLVLLALGGCSATAGALPAFRAYYDATAPDFRRYVAADATLDQTQKARRIQAADSAQKYLDAAAAPPAK